MPRRKQKPFLKYIIAAGIVIVAGLAVTMLRVDDSLVVFYTPQEAIAKAQDIQDRKIRIGAMVEPGSVVWHPETLDLEFRISDLRDSHIKVSHKGQPPDMFKEGSGVVVEGRLAPDGQSFASQKLIVKHSEEYKAPGDHDLLDPAMIQKGMLKNESIQE